jgi:hypothetical protein
MQSSARVVFTATRSERASAPRAPIPQLARDSRVRVLLVVSASERPIAPRAPIVVPSNDRLAR